MARKSGQIIPRGERKWLVRWYVGEVNGRRKYKAKTVHGTKRDAQKLLTSMLRSQDLGTYVEPNKMTLDEYLDRWLEEAAPKKRRERTVFDYREMLRLHVRPHLGEQRLDRLTVLDVQAMVNALETKGLAPQSIRYANAVLSAAFSQAVRWRLVSSNPCREVELPKRVFREMTALSHEQWGAFRSALSGTKHETLFLLLASTGLRPSEALGLMWSHVDLEQAQLRVDQVLARKRGGGWTLTPPKTPKSRRTVPLPSSLVAAIRGHGVRQKEHRLRLGSAYGDHGFVFASELGEPLDRRNLVQRHFKPLLEKAGIDPSVRLYDLRHSAATFMLATSGDARAVADRLGHSSAKMTLDVYAHTLESQSDALTDRMEETLFGG